MTMHKDEQWLDGELRRVIKTSRPKFDADAWKRTYPMQFQALLARGRERASSWRHMPARRLGRLAVAAVVVVGMSFLLIRSMERQSERPALPPAVGESPARVVSLRSLTIAYRQEGEHGLNRRLDTALSTLGPRPRSVSAQELLEDFDS